MASEPSIDVLSTRIEPRGFAATPGTAGFRHPFDARVVEAATRLGVDAALDAVFEMTASLFPGPIEISADDDPEVIDDTRLLFLVEARAAPHDILSLELEWIHRLRQFGTRVFSTFCISIAPRT